MEGARRRQLSTRCRRTLRSPFDSRSLAILGTERGTLRSPITSGRGLSAINGTAE
jgi:hypothetical protein